MSFHSSATESSVFSRPTSPAARVFCLMQRRRVSTRKDILHALGLSQPTVTRAVQALIAEGLLAETRPKSCPVRRKRGRPITPVELAHANFAYMGLVLQPQHTYVGLFNIQGKCVGEDTLQAVNQSDPDYEWDIAPILDSLTTLLSESKTHFVAGGVASWQPETLSPNFIRDISLGFEEGLYEVNYCVSSDIASAIVASEIQTDLSRTVRTAVLYDAAGTLSAAVSTPDSVVPIPLASSDAEKAGIELIEACQPRIVILAGDRFLQDPEAAKTVMHSWKTHYSTEHSGLSRSVLKAHCTGVPSPDVEFRVIPSDKKMDRAAARAIALDQVRREPLGLHCVRTI